MFGSSDVCGGLAPSLLFGDVPEAAVSSGEGTLAFLLPASQQHAADWRLADPTLLPAVT